MVKSSVAHGREQRTRAVCGPVGEALPDEEGSTVVPIEEDDGRRAVEIDDERGHAVLDVG